jgi:hypothetical protein
MAQHEHPVIDSELPIDPADSLHIETPVIDIQDLEHKPGPHARISHKGLKIEPRIDDPRGISIKADKDVLDALQEFEKSLRGLQSD